MNKFLFTHIPKTGGTSIAAALGLCRPIGKRHFPAKQTFGYSFAFVRNPWDRMVSYYMAGRTWDLRTWLEFLERDDIVDQISFIYDDQGKLIVDFVGRFENLAEDFDIVCQRIGIETPTLPHLNRSIRSDYRDYYNAYAKSLVAKKFERDNSMFGYSF